MNFIQHRMTPYLKTTVYSLRKSRNYLLQPLMSGFCALYWRPGGESFVGGSLVRPAFNFEHHSVGREGNQCMPNALFDIDHATRSISCHQTVTGEHLTLGIKGHKPQTACENSDVFDAFGHWVKMRADVATQLNEVDEPLYPLLIAAVNGKHNPLAGTGPRRLKPRR